MHEGETDNMEHVHGIGEQADLLSVVRHVRARWRLKRALVGAAITAAATYAVYALMAWMLYSANYSDQSVIAGRLVCVLSFVGLAIYFIARPLRPKIGDSRTALYMEEHEPSLEGVLFTAVEVDASNRAGVAPKSPALAGRLMDSAMDRVRSISGGRNVDAEELQRGWAILGGVLIAATLLTVFGPPPLQSDSGC